MVFVVGDFGISAGEVLYVHCAQEKLQLTHDRVALTSPSDTVTPGGVRQEVPGH